ncbi:hypothetical protein [Desulfospira joergensenii]|uniref:hypothetical protein n=1 Tax=Desulfospira joergensenii TaxID=53329 RepID=UPI0003B7A62D|nr:hypothetical protein [Desulfospira joergensenii]
MEDSGDTVTGEIDSRESLFGETIPELNESGEVITASSQSSDSKEGEEGSAKEKEGESGDEGQGQGQEGEGQEKKSPEDSEKAGEERGSEEEKGKESEKDSESGKEKEAPAEVAQLTSDLEKMTEHKTNLEKALSSERAKVRSLQFALDQKPVQTKKKPESKIDPEFKVLSDEEFDELWEENPKEAAIYQRKLFDHKQAVSEQKAEQKRIDDEERAERDFHQNIIRTSLEEVSQAVPGIYDDESIGKALTEYAVEQGFQPDELVVLSNPATMVIPQGSDKPLPLGKAAVSFVKFCSDAMKSKEVDISQIREEIRKEEADKLLKKFKDNPKEAAPGLDEVQTVKVEIPGAWKPKTEEELAVMTEPEREAYYSGLQ